MSYHRVYNMQYWDYHLVVGMNTEGSPARALCIMVRHAACGAQGSVSVIEPHSQTPGVLTGDRIWGALSKRFVKCVRKAPHPFGLEPNPALNRSLDENLVYKF